MANKLILHNHLIFYFFWCVCLIFTDGVSLWSSWSVDFGLHQVVLLQVELQDGVFDGGEDEADVLGVGGAGEVRVDDLVAVRVQVDKHLQDELPGRLSIPLWTVILREVVYQMRVHDLLLQQVLLVEEQDYGRVLEPGVSDNCPK